MTYRCAICGSQDSISLDTRSRVPIAQNFILPTVEEALNCPVGALDMQRCTVCGFVWNAAFDSTLMVYDATYDNDQNFSDRFVDHIGQVAARIEREIDADQTINLVEVGCGQGAFMGLMGRRLGNRLRSAIGFDPAWQADPRHLPPCGKVRAKYFRSDSILRDDPAPNLVISRHVIEHVPDPLGFLRAIRGAIPHGTLVFIETPDVDWILRNGVFFDFYYEHCSIFAQPTLVLALELAGFEVKDVRPMFDDQYQLATAVASSEPAARDPLPTGRYDDLGFLAKRAEFIGGLTAAIDGLGPRGSVALWGGASKGVTICLTLPAAGERIGCVIDINERKQGGYLPGSAIPIVSPTEAASRGIKTAVVVNPAYLNEIRAGLARDQLDLEVTSIEACG